MLQPIFKHIPDIVHVVAGADTDDTATAANFVTNFTADVVEDFEIPRGDLNVSIEGDRQDWISCPMKLICLFRKRTMFHSYNPSYLFQQQQQFDWQLYPTTKEKQI